MAVSAQTPDIMGERQYGQDVRTQNGTLSLSLYIYRYIFLYMSFGDVWEFAVMACQAVANIVKSSLGPVGLDKMLVDDIGDVTITNDGSTVLKMLDVEHPAAKVLVELAELQDREVGDGTTSVVIIAAELRKRANDLVRNKIHPTSIISGYRLAMREAYKYVDDKLAVKVEELGKDSLVNCAKTSMSSKLIAGNSDFFANLVVEAVQAVKMTNSRGEIKYRIKLLKAGANVVLTTKGIDDMALKYFVEAGAIAVRRVRKVDIRQVAKATGATVVSSFADMEGEETFDSSLLGHAEEVVEERIADDNVSLILRGANDYMLDKIERALHDSLCIIKRTLESNTISGGAVEAALSVYLEYLATTLGSREQLAIAEFAESLLIIPKDLKIDIHLVQILAVNAAKDTTELVAKLRAYHHTAQTKPDKKHLSSMGLDLLKGTVRNNLEAVVIEPAMSKVKIIQFATEAAITILRIDDMIKLLKDESQNGED
ncbi:T-complex protein 1 subunit alpha [Camellia lanceoleosa]|uniref:T-complex protein 1 subunit alpha n=1 Tax=Camellia lanceoleosa TaxID=1840588 RepID=A0ACC0IIW6_9ERIC|nr:T-complex protein 1 subunit alpha [Camellia lanceoleosa]